MNSSRVIKILDILNVDKKEFDINLKIIRGLDYYTGTVLPGVGISIGLTRLFFVLQEIGFIDNYELSNENDYLIIPIGDTIEYALSSLISF